MHPWIIDHPDTITGLVATLTQFYSDAEHALLSAAHRTITTMEHPDGTVMQRATAINELRAASEHVARSLATATPELIDTLLSTAAHHGATAALSLIEGGESLLAVREGARSSRAIAATFADLTNACSNVQQRILRFPNDVYQQVIAHTNARMLAGSTQAHVQASAWQSLRARGVTGFVDKAGRNWNLTSYVEMASRTASMRAWQHQHLATMHDLGVDLVTIVMGRDGCEKCGAWANKILRTTPGATGILAMESIVDGSTVQVRVAGTLDEAKAAGWQHPNCGCVAVAYQPGLDAVTGSTYDAQGDADRVRQRELEREIRTTKRDMIGTEGAQRKALERDVRELQREVREHTKASEQRRKRRREQVDFQNSVYDGPLVGPKLRSAKPAAQWGVPEVELTGDDIRHVLDGEPEDPALGGHRFGTGRLNKTEFPETWNDEKIIAAVQQVVNSPHMVRATKGSEWRFGIVDDVLIQAVFSTQAGSTKFRTAYPKSGTGIFRNTSKGKMKVPLDAKILEEPS